MKPKQVPAQLVVDRSVELANRLEVVAFNAVDAGMDDALAKASAKDRAIIAGIAIEKVQLLRGRPTSRQESLNVTLVASGTLEALGDTVLKALSEGKR